MAQSISSNRKTAQQSLRSAAEDLAGEIATLNTLEPAALLQSGRLYSVLTRPRSSHASSWSGRSLTGCRSKGMAV
jgi:hypothetical protein